MAVPDTPPPPQQQPQPVVVQINPFDVFAKPAKFKGERGANAGRFLTEMHLFIQHHAATLTTVTTQVQCALTHMEGAAASFKDKYSGVTKVFACHRHTKPCILSSSLNFPSMFVQ